jgi:hypothetical protein
MNNQNSPRLYVNVAVEADGWEVGRPQGNVVLNLRQQGGGYVSATFTPAQAHEIGKLLLIPDSRDRAEAEG